MKKILSVIVTLSIILICSVQVFAASTPLPIKTYTLSSSGKVYAYTASDLKTKTGGYIACATDECMILKVSGKAVQVKYPVNGGTKTAWFYRNEFTDYDLSKGVGSSFKQSGKVTTYRRSDGKNSYGYISNGDTCYKLATKGSYEQVLYPVSGGYKLGWVNKSSGNNQSGKLSSPVPAGCYFNKKTQDGSWFGYHDININVSTGTPVYAITDGTVTFKEAYRIYSGTKKLTSYGNYIEFTSADGEYTAKYCHLSNFNGATPKITATVQVSGSTGTLNLGSKKVKKGDVIGYIGKTGNASGVHLHFELRKKGSRIDPTSVISGLTR